MMNRFKTAISDKLAWVISLSLTIFMYTFALSLYSPLTITGLTFNPSEIKAGESFRLCRTLEYTRDTSVEISRALTRNLEDGTVDTVSFQSIFVPRKRGIKTVCRDIVIPTWVTEGDWVFRTYVRVTTPPFWFTSFEIESLNIKVYK